MPSLTKRFTQILSVVLGVVLISAASSALAREGWLSNVDEGMAKAKEEGKDVLLDFGGSDWCHWCRELNKEVYSQEAFQQANQQFVLVSLDFPKDRTGMSVKQQKHNQAWQQKFQVPGFPMVFLLDANGQPYAKTGYREGGVDKYMEHLAELQGIKKKRDAALQLAKSAQGVERAKHLDTAIQTMEPALAWLAYEKLIQQIAVLDAEDEAGLRSKYGAAIQRRAINKEIQPILDGFKPQNALETVKKLEDLRDKLGLTGQIRREFNGKMGQMLVFGGNFDEAITMADEVLAEEGLDEGTALNWHALKIQALAKKKEFDAALKELDGVMATGKVTGDPALALQGLRAQILVGAGRDADAVAALDGFLPTVPNGELKQQLMGLRNEIQKRLDANTSKDPLDALAPLK